MRIVETGSDCGSIRILLIKSVWVISHLHSKFNNVKVISHVIPDSRHSWLVKVMTFTLHRLRFFVLLKCVYGHYFILFIQKLPPHEHTINKKQTITVWPQCNSTDFHHYPTDSRVPTYCATDSRPTAVTFSLTDWLPTRRDSTSISRPTAPYQRCFLFSRLICCETLFNEILINKQVENTVTRNSLRSKTDDLDLAFQGHWRSNWLRYPIRDL